MSQWRIGTQGMGFMTSDRSLQCARHAHCDHCWCHFVNYQTRTALQAQAAQTRLLVLNSDCTHIVVSLPSWFLCYLLWYRHSAKSEIQVNLYVTKHLILLRILRRSVACHCASLEPVLWPPYFTEVGVWNLHPVLPPDLCGCERGTLPMSELSHWIKALGHCKP